jgi:hypothetical protein
VPFIPACRKNRACAVIAFVLGAAPAIGQLTPPPPLNDITVIGELPDREAADAFVEGYVVESRIGQFARWFEPVCVRTWGLDLAYNAYISNHVMDVAERLGIPTVRSEYCVPNVRVGFTADPQGVIDRIGHRGNHLVLGFHYARQHERLTTIRYPVQAWYATTTRNYRGAESLDQVGYQTVPGEAGTRLGSRLSSGLAHVLILVDSRVAVGQPTESVADLVAFMALVQSSQRDACAPGDSILDLMVSSCPAAGPEPRLSAQDFAFLRALYTVNPTLGAQQQRSAIVQGMSRPPSAPE